MYDALSQLSDSQLLLQKSPTIQITLPMTNEVNKFPDKIEDPLRELVLYSNDENADPEKLKYLALSAANLVTEVAGPSSNSVPRNMKSLAGIFAGTGNFIRNVEENIAKKYSALDPSENEGFGGH